MKRKAPRVQHPVGGESLAQEHMAKEADINTIVKRFMRTGTLPIKNGGYYADVSSNDLLTMRNAIADMDSHFQSLPARIRRRFGGDPYQLVRWIENPDNHEEAVKLGLMVHVDGNPVKQTELGLSGAGEGPDEVDELFEDEEAPEAPQGAQNRPAQRPKDPPKKGGKK